MVVRTHSAFLHQVSDHDYNAGVLFPHHPPEVLECGFERTLSCYVGLGFVVALQRREKQKYTSHTVKFIHNEALTSMCSADITHIHIVGIDVVTVFGVFACQRPELHSTVVVWRKKERWTVRGTSDLYLLIYCHFRSI